MAFERAVIDFEFDGSVGMLVERGGPDPWLWTIFAWSTVNEDWLPYAYATRMLCTEVEFLSQCEGFMVFGEIRDLPDCFEPAEPLWTKYFEETDMRHGGWFMPDVAYMKVNDQDRICVLGEKVVSIPARPKRALRENL